MQKNSNVFVAGHRGLVGSAIVRKLKQQEFSRIQTASRAELDLRNKDQVYSFFEKSKPEFVFLAAAKVGGIHANNTYPYDFIHENLLIQQNLIGAAFDFKVSKLCFLGSSCIYPKFATQPIKEEALLSGPLEPTNEPYAVAKIAGIITCQSLKRQHGFNAISIMPTNLYGPNDNFNLESSHVLPALMRKFHDGKTNKSESVTLWGSGSPRREFLHVDDMADACVYLMNHYDSEKIINVGSGHDLTIKELALLISEVVGYKGKIEFDLSKPDGTPRKLMDTTKINSIGWRPKISLREGIEQTYRWFLENVADLKK